MQEALVSKAEGKKGLVSLPQSLWKEKSDCFFQTRRVIKKLSLFQALRIDPDGEKFCRPIDPFYLLLTEDQFWARVGAGVELSKLGGSPGKWTIGEAGFFKSM